MTINNQSNQTVKTTDNISSFEEDSSLVNPGELLLTPGTDIFPFFSTPSVAGRNGNDFLLAFDPGTSSQNQSPNSIQTLIGDAQEGTGNSEGNDTFILGDWYQPYYQDASTVNSGILSYAIIEDFNPRFDTVVLYGNPTDYLLSEFDNNTQIYLKTSTNNLDLIGVLSGVSDLSLNSSYFSFKGTNPSPITIDRIGQLGTRGVDDITSVAPAPDNQIYVAGYTSGSLVGNNRGSMDGWFALYDSEGNEQWSKQIGDNNWNVVWDAVSDSEGNLYLLEVNRGIALFNVAVSKYDNRGNQVWRKNINDVEGSLRIDIDPNGDYFYVSGVNIGTEYAEEWNPVIAKYNTSNGNPVWRNEILTTTYLPDESYAVAADDQGNVFASGWTYGSLGGVNSGLYDVWTAKFDPLGNLLWIEQLGSRGFEFAWAIDTDSESNAYVGGWTSGNLSGRLRGSYDGFIAKYDERGNRKWIEQIGGNGDDQVTNLIVGEDDHIYVTGFTNGNLGGESTESYDAFVAKYNDRGKQIWLEKLPNVGTEIPRNITMDALGSVYVTGMTDGSVGILNEGSYDGWVAKLDSISGNIQDFSNFS